jgi:serine/threonine protein phosphatase PrpC
LKKHSGNPKVLIAEPGIKAIRLSDNQDFILIASDGIFDRLSNKEAIGAAWGAIRANQNKDKHAQCTEAVDAVMKYALLKRSLDNISVLMIRLSNAPKQKQASKFIGKGGKIFNSILRGKKGFNFLFPRKKKFEIKRLQTQPSVK